MPIYTYEHPTSGKRIDVVQHMNDKHIYVHTDGVEWKRVFEVPQASIDGIDNIDPFNKQAFMERTGNMRGITQGDLWDISAELSRKRAKKAGKDPVKEKAKRQYFDKTGKAHPHAGTKSGLVEKHVNIHE